MGRLQFMRVLVLTVVFLIGACASDDEIVTECQRVQATMDACCKDGWDGAGRRTGSLF